VLACETVTIISTTTAGIQPLYCGNALRLQMSQQDRQTDKKNVG